MSRKDSSTTHNLQQHLRSTLYERQREHEAINKHAIVSIADQQGNITYVNERFCAVSGYSKPELLGQNHRIVKSGRHTPEFYKDLWATIRKGEVWQGEICNRRKDGTLYWVDSTIVPFMDDRGKPYQYVSIRTDITKLKLTELTLRRQRSLQKLIILRASQLMITERHGLDEAVTKALQASGKFIGADRASLFLVSADGTHMRNSLTWCAPGVRDQWKPTRNKPISIPTWWRQQINTRQQIVVSDTSLLPDDAAEERTLFLSRDICSLLVFPLKNGAQPIGFIGYEVIHTPRQWDEQENSLLRLLADVISGSLARKEAEQAILDSEEDLIATLEATQDGILAVDNQRRVIFANRRFQEMWGLGKEDSLAEADDHRLLARASGQVDDPNAFLEGVEAIYASGESSHEIVTLSDGRIIERSCSPLIRRGKPAGMVWNFHDITSLKHAEAAAERNQERLRRGQLYANIGTWEWDIASGELYWSERIAPLFGYAEGSLETSFETFIDSVHPEDRQAVIKAIDASLERNVPYEIEHRVVWPDGAIRWLMERGAVTRDEAGSPTKMLGVVQDIDERKRTELDLVAAREDAEKANQAKSEFLSSMSHELRTPMNAILGFAQLMENDDTLPDDHIDSVEEILKAGRHLLNLINDVLDLARIESGKLELDLEPVPICPLVHECIRLMAPLAEKKAIHISHDNLSGAVIRADRTRLKQVLLNLLSNGIKYNHQGGRVEVTRGKPGAEGCLRLEIRDTGHGIEENQLSNLFQPFSRLDAKKKAIEGTGIGLNITKRIVEMMGGTLGVRSKPGVGSVFWVEVPMESNVLQPVHRASKSPGYKKQKTKHRDPSVDDPVSSHFTVLHIEDNPANIKLVAQILNARSEINLLSAHTPELGIELATAHKPALILMDINMPGMDGYQVLERLQGDKQLRDTPVVAVTANAMPSDIDRGQAAGFADYLTKPLHIPQMMEMLDRFLKGNGAKT